MDLNEYVCVNIKEEPIISADQSKNLSSVVKEELVDVDVNEDSADYIYHDVFVTDENMKSEEEESSDDDDMDWLDSSGESESSWDDECSSDSDVSENFASSEESDCSSNMSFPKSDVSENLLSLDESTFDSSFEIATSDSDDYLEDDSDTNDKSQPDIETLSLTSKWKPVTTHSRIFSFTGKEELRSHISVSEDEKIWPIDVYKQFVTDEVINLIVVETNRYAAKVLDSEDKNSELRKWTSTSYEEIKKFMGITLFMAMRGLASSSCLWPKNNNMFYGNKIIRKTMSLKRYLSLLGMLHFSDNEVPSVTRYQKISPLINLLNLQFCSLYSSGSSLVISDTFVPFKNLVPRKQHKYGCKIYKLCTVEGYTLNSKILCRKEERLEMFLHPESFIMSLMVDNLDKGVTLYTDFTSVSLAESLLSHKTYTCGFILGKHKHLPSEVVNAKLKKGEVVSKENEKGVKVFKWKSGSSTSIIVSTIPDHDEKITSTGEVTRSGKEVKVPKFSYDFVNAKKKVVDHDYEFTNTKIFTKTVKWYKKVAVELLTGTCVTNSWLIYNKYYASKQWSFNDFKQSLWLSLLTGLPEMESKPKKISKSISGGSDLLQDEGSVKII